MELFLHYLELLKVSVCVWAMNQRCVFLVKHSSSAEQSPGGRIPMLQASWTSGPQVLLCKASSSVYIVLF